MYVRLKRTLSSLALEMLQRAPRLRPIAWLLGYVRLAPHGGPVPLEALRREAATIGPAGPRGLARLEALGILERAKGIVRLAPEYAAYAPYFGRQVERLGRALATLDGMGVEHPAPPLARGILLFNAGLFFECHEYLEDIWRATAGRDRNLYHSIIQAAAAFYHFEKNNLHGAWTLMEKALQKLEAYRPEYLGVDVDSLIADLRSWVRRFQSGKVGRTLRPEEFPRIHGHATIGTIAEG